VPLLFVNVPLAPPSDQTAEVAPPLNDPPSAAVVPPWQTAVKTPPTVATGLGLTVRVLLEVAEVQPATLAVSVSVTVEAEPALAVYVAVPGVDPPLFEKVPPAPPSSQIPEVAPPPTDPPRAPVVPPWQTAVNAPPEFAVGGTFTVTDLVPLVVPHEPPLVVRVRIIDPVAAIFGVYVVVPGVEPSLLVNVPPATPSVQIAEVAPPPNPPFRAAVVPPWHIAGTAAPMLTVGFGFTVSDLLADDEHGPPVVTRVRVTVTGAEDEAVYVAVFGVVPRLLEKVPPAPPSFQIAPVAVPPNVPPRAPVVPPWHIAVRAPPALTGGSALIVSVFVSVWPSQVPPCEVNVSTTDPVAPAGGV